METRRSGWEIHPVYSIDVCKNKTIQHCKPNDTTEGMWTPLEVWLIVDEDEDGEDDGV